MIEIEIVRDDYIILCIDVDASPTMQGWLALHSVCGDGFQETSVSVVKPIYWQLAQPFETEFKPAGNWQKKGHLGRIETARPVESGLTHLEISQPWSLLWAV